MARPIDEEKHYEVVLAAFDSLRRRGVVGVTMADIAGDLGMSRSALYWYVHGLGELFEQMLELVLERQGFVTLQAVTAVSHPLDQLAAWMRATARFYSEDPDLIGVLLQLWATARPGSKDETLEAFRVRFEPVHEAARGLIIDGIAAGQIADCDPVALVDLCAVVLDGALVHRLSRGLDSAKVIDEFLALVVAPLRRNEVAADRCAAQPEIHRQSVHQRSVENPAPRPAKREDWMAWD